MNFIRKLPLFLALYGLLTGGCALFDDNTPKKTSTTGLISTPATYYSTAKARYLGTRYKENLERLIERIVRDPKTTTLQFANNISSVGGIGFFTHSATQSPDERYLEVVLATPETFETKGVQSEKVARLFSAYGQALLGILVNDSDIFQDKELSGYGLNLAWRNVTAAATGNRVSMERAILYFSKERVRGFLRHEFSQDDLLNAAVIFAAEEDRPLQLVSYRPQELRPDSRPAIREDNLASTESSAKTATVGVQKPAGTNANQKIAQKSDSTKTIPATTKEPAPAPKTKLETTDLKAETKTQTLAEQKPGEAIAKAAPTPVVSMTKAKPSVPAPPEPVVAKQSAAAAIMNPKPDGATQPESRPEPKPVPPVVAAVKKTVVETKSNNETPNAPAPAIVPDATVEQPQKAPAVVEAKQPEAIAPPAPAVKLLPATPLPDVKPAAVPAPTPVKVESLPAPIKSRAEVAVAETKVPIQETRTPALAVMKMAEPVKSAEPQKAPAVVEAKLPEAITPPAPAVKLLPATPLPDVKPAAVPAPTPVKVESLPAPIKRRAEVAVAETKVPIQETRTPIVPSPPPVMKMAEPVKSAEPQKAPAVVEAKLPEAITPPAPAVKLLPATPLPDVKPAAVPAPTPVKVESLPAPIKSRAEVAVAETKVPIQETRTPIVPSPPPVMKMAEPVKSAEPQKAPAVVEAKLPEAITPPAPAVKLLPATPLPDVKPSAVPTPTPVKVETVPAPIKSRAEVAVAETKVPIQDTRTPIVPSPPPVMKMAEPAKQALPVAPTVKPEPPVAAQKSAEPAVAAPAREIAGDKVAGEQIALLKNKPVESKLENKPVVRSAPKALEGFIVQIAFSDKEKALRWAEDMERRGYAVSITEAGAEGRLRVRLGNFAQRDDAERQLRNFKQDGLNGIIINLPQGFQPEARSSMP